MKCPPSSHIILNKELESERGAILLDLYPVQKPLGQFLSGPLSGNAFLSALTAPQIVSQGSPSLGQLSPAFCHKNGRIQKCISGLSQFPSNGIYLVEIISDYILSAKGSTPYNSKLLQA